MFKMKTLTSEQELERDNVLRMLEICEILSSTDEEITEEDIAFAKKYFEDHDLEWVTNTPISM